MLTKSRRFSVQPVLGVAVILLASGAVAGCKKSQAKWGLPVDAKQLPGTTELIEAEMIDGMRETDPKIKQEYTASELGSEICRRGMSDPARELEIMGMLGSSSAKQFFKAANLEQVQGLLECGNLLTASLKTPFQTGIGFTDDSSSKQEVGILELTATDMPPKYGLTKHSFGTLDGFCRTSDPSKPNAPVMDCGPASEAALRQDTKWFLGKRAALDSIAHGIATPKTDLTTQVAALNDAAAAAEGLTSMRIAANVTSSKSYLSAPCTWASFQTAGSSSEFATACFPQTDDKIIQDIDSKLRAAVFEIEPDVMKAMAVHGNIVLIARDDDAAKEVEKNATDLAADWKSTMQNNEAKLTKNSKTNPVTLRQKNWAIVIDDFEKAIEGIKVSRSGRAVKLAFNDPLADDDKKDLDVANKETLDRRAAIADVLGAISDKKPIPVDSLGKIIGAPWAAYISQMAIADASKVGLSPAECTDVKKSIAKLKAKDMPNHDSALLLQELQSASCAHPPNFSATVHTCIIGGLHSGADFAKCAPASEPPESEYGDKALKSATK